MAAILVMLAMLVPQEKGSEEIPADFHLQVSGGGRTPSSSWNSVEVAADGTAKCTHQDTCDGSTKPESVEVKIPMAALQRLVGVIETEKFFDLDKKYDPGSRDGTSVIVELGMGGRRHAVGVVNQKVVPINRIVHVLNGLLPEKFRVRYNFMKEGLEGGVKAVLTLKKTEFHVGERLELSVKLINETGAPVVLVGSLDGSYGERFPQHHIEIRDAKEEPVQPKEPLRRCGNMNVLAPDDFVTVPAGGSIDPYAPGFADPLLSRWLCDEPGTYRVRYVCDYTEKDIQKWRGWDGHEGFAEGVAEAFEKVPKIRIESEPVEIVVKKSP